MPERTVEDVTRNQELPGMGWLAGYPRSGAALVRTILAHCFGQTTGSCYPEDHIGEEYGEAVRMVPLPLPMEDMKTIIAQQGRFSLKTHALPVVADGLVPTVVIVRDGRRTLESLRAFYAENNGLEYTMMQMVEGHHVWGSWSKWVRAWANLAAPDALWLRYEDIMADVAGAVDRLASWMGRTPVGHDIPPFESLHANNPTIFRATAVDGNGGMTADEEGRFWELHGGTMRMLGYYS